MNNIKIEKANKNDLKEILDLQKLAFQTEAEIYNDFHIQPLLQSYEEILAEFEENVFIKAIVENKIVGSARANLKDKICWIAKVIVHPDYRKQGIGKKIMQEMERQFSKAEKFQLGTGYKSATNIKFYKDLGYKIFDLKQIDEKLSFVFMEKKNTINLNIDVDQIKSHEDYKKFWGNISKVEIKMIEKNEKCKHNIGDVFVYESPYKKPADVCNALLYVLDLYIWRSALGFPSWEEDDRGVYRIHCPDKKGTVWEMRKI